MKKIFLTGASSGIGEAFAHHYAQAGAQLALTARRRPLLEALSANLLLGASVAPPAVLYAVDVCDAAAMQAAAAEFMAQHGVPDMVIANAGVSSAKARAGVAEGLVFKQVMDTNVLGMVHTLQPFIAAMKARGSGTLVGIASVAGFRGFPGSAAYSASKAAAISYLESLRIELRGSGVRVVTICPGYIRTPLTEASLQHMPFLLDADEAVRRFARAIERGTSFAVIPWQMGLIGRLLKVMPNALFDRLLGRSK